MLQESLPIKDRAELRTSAVSTFFANVGLLIDGSQASRAKSAVVIRYQGLEDEAYSLLPDLLRRIEGDNPGAVTSLDVDQTTYEFRRAFISLPQSQVKPSAT